MVPELCLGTMMFGGQTCEADSLAIMGYAYEQGLNFWDTADVYNHGESERIVGKGLKGRRGNIVLATKVGSDMGDGPNARGLSRYHIVASVEDSLRRLGTDYLDIYYLHTPDYGTRMEETLDTMATLVRAGKIRYVGVSNYAAWQMADMLSICEKNGGVKPVITQNVYNLITRGIEAELVPFLTRHEIGMVVYNPIAAGLLVGKHKREAPQQNTRFANNKNYYDRYWAEENFDAVDKLAAIAAEAGVGLLELSMKWCLAQKGVTSVITGVSRLEQLEQNIASVKGETLDERTIDRCNAVWDALPVGSRFAYNR
jgi:aryl-alcohol dehydrogenase-like predicted oxidoreductase